MKKLLLGLLLVCGAAAAQNTSVVTLVSQGADPTGASDVSAALIKAAAFHGTILVTPGKYLLNGTATVALNNINIECQGTTANANANYGASGATFLITSTTVQPFTLANGVRIRGCNFFYPNQTGTSPTPVVYPPLFTEASGAQVTNFDLLQDRIVGAYDVLNQTSTADGFGGIVVDGTYGYAIHSWFQLANVPETMYIRGMIADVSLGQNVFLQPPNYYLANWTAQNGVFLHVFGNGNGTTTSSTVTVQGIIFDGSVFGYNKFVWVDNTGALGESTFRGIVDAVPGLFREDSGGCSAAVQFDVQFWSYLWNPAAPGPGGSDFTTAFVINTPASGFNCTTNNIYFKGLLNTAQGNVVALSGAYIGAVSINLAADGIYGQTSTSGTYYYAIVNAANATVDLSGNHVQPKTASSSYRGMYIESAYQVTINGNIFNGVYNPINVALSTIPFSATGNTSLFSPAGSTAVFGTGTYVHNALMPGVNSWDLVQPPTLGSCGSGSTINGGSTDQTGSVALGAGTITSCVLTFNQAYTNGGNCIATANSGAAYTAGTNNATSTFNFPSTGTALWYHCTP